MNTLLFRDSQLPEDYVDAIELAVRASSLVLPGVGGLVCDKWIEVDHYPKLGKTTQVDANIIDGLKSWQNGALSIVATGEDLGHRSVNFLFGMSKTGQGQVIVSSYRLSPEQLFATTVHEIGHSFGLVEPSSERYDNSSSFAGHCAVDNCVMKEVNNVVDMQRAFNAISDNPTQAGHCDGCAADLSRTHYA